MAARSTDPEDTPSDPEDTPSKDDVEQDFAFPAEPDLETGAEPDQPA